MALFNYILHQAHRGTPPCILAHLSLSLAGVLIHHFVQPAQQSSLYTYIAFVSAIVFRLEAWSDFMRYMMRFSTIDSHGLIKVHLIEI